MVKQGYKPTEIGVIPEDWEVVPLSNVFSYISYGFTNPMPTTNNGSWMVTANDVKNGRINYETARKTSEYAFKKLITDKSRPRVGDLLLTKDGTLGRVAIVDKSNICINQSVAVIRTNDKIEVKFLKHLLQDNFYQKVMIENAGGSTIKHIYITVVDKMPIVLPPLAEQEAIAAALSDADAWIDSLEQLIAKKRLIKQGAMQTLLTPPSHAEALEAWEVKKLGEVASYRRGSFPQPYGLDKWYDDTNGMPFIQVFDVAKNRKLKIDTKRKISELAQPMSVFVPKGTIVLTIQGSIGRIALTQYDAYCDRTLLIFEKIDSGLDKFYFLLAVEQIFEIEKEKAPGGTIKTITKEALSDFEIKYPKSLSEQERIATILSDMDAELEALATQLGKARQIKQGMMQELLTGRTRLV
ncbi:restriction endonuclease subunit S [Empedobacter falsenii]